MTGLEFNRLQTLAREESWKIMLELENQSYIDRLEMANSDISKGMDTLEAYKRRCLL